MTSKVPGGEALTAPCTVLYLAPLAPPQRLPYRVTTSYIQASRADCPAVPTGNHGNSSIFYVKEPTIHYYMRTKPPVPEVQTAEAYVREPSLSRGEKVDCLTETERGRGSACSSGVLDTDLTGSGASSYLICCAE